MVLQRNSLLSAKCWVSYGRSQRPVGVFDKDGYSWGSVGGPSVPWFYRTVGGGRVNGGEDGKFSRVKDEVFPSLWEFRPSDRKEVIRLETLFFSERNTVWRENK